jgi:hypothetical protein
VVFADGFEPSDSKIFRIFIQELIVVVDDIVTDLKKFDGSFGLSDDGIGGLA